MSLFLSIGECLVELYAATDDLWHLGIAGDTLNTAFYARAMLPSDWEVGYVTRLGRDSFSDRAAEFITSKGISLPAIPRHSGRNIGLYAISLTRGERSFTYWRDASAARTLMETREAVEAEVAKADALYVSGISLAILPPEGREWLTQLMLSTRARGAVCAFDPNYRARLWSDAESARQAIAAAANAASIVLPSFDDEASLFGDSAPAKTAHRYAMLSAGLVVVKNGRGAVSIVEQGRAIERITLPSVDPVDTTGAGDSFNGAFLAALLTGETVIEAVHAAHAVAKQVVRQKGALVSLVY
jgi:2-dehydro-3-deoxygluconokinase